MYGKFWSLLPGPVWLRAIVALIVAVAVFLLLMEVVFPWVSTLMPYNDVAV
ncbi:membrane protein [Corynebacterium phocae]|uniref:Membrane protein n=1 Tax=Corynebacterium phocae TaxID=161895 RepID=A0A1L7D5R2_9CORY|nr:hypothetical protein [Corynebacterium phocae]APT93450.1 membrane protein [Corynebacterium phocae]